MAYEGLATQCANFVNIIGGKETIQYYQRTSEMGEGTTSDDGWADPISITAKRRYETKINQDGMPIRTLHFHIWKTQFQGISTTPPVIGDKIVSTNDYNSKTHWIVIGVEHQSVQQRFRLEVEKLLVAQA